MPPGRARPAGRPGGGGIRGSLVAVPQRKQISAFWAISVPQSTTIQLDHYMRAGRTEVERRAS